MWQLIGTYVGPAVRVFKPAALLEARLGDALQELVPSRALHDILHSW